MKILLVSFVPTNPVRAGNSRLIIDQAELLNDMGHEVHYLYVSDLPIRRILAGDEDPYLPPMRKYWGERLHVFRVGGLSKLLMLLKKRYARITRHGFDNADSRYPMGIVDKIKLLDKQYKYDVCIVNYYYLSKVLSEISIPVRAILTHDVFTYRSLATGKKYNRIGNLTPNEEAKVAWRCPHILSVQEEDTTFFKKISPCSHTYTVFTSVKFHGLPLCGNHTILYFSGNSPLNLEGLNWFIDSVWPMVHEKWADAKLLIAGGICNGLNASDLPPGIILVGYIDNPADFFCKGDVAINPTRLGTGLKIKTIESLCYNRITMVSPHSMEGLYSKTPVPLFASESPIEWADFLDNIWSDRTILESIRAKNEIYIRSLDNFIRSEYNRLFSFAANKNK